MKKFYLSFLTLLLINTASFAAVWYSAPAGGAANTLTNWWSTTGGTGTNPVNFTTAGDVFTIQSSMTLPASATWTVTGSINLTSGYLLGNTNNINIGGSLTLSGSSYINSSSGALYIYIGGDFTMSGSSYITNSPSFNYIYMNNASSTLASPQHINWAISASGNWSYVYVSAGCTSQLTGNSTWTASSYALQVDGTLDCQGFAFQGASPFIVSNGGTLVTSNTLGVNGAITTSGTKTMNVGSSYVFNGTAAQVTGTQMPASLTAPSTITINNTAGVTLSQTTTSTGTLAFTNGIFSLGANTLTLPGATASVTGAGAGKYVNGALLKTISGLTSVNYEVGNASGYEPMLLSFNTAGTGGNFGVKVTSGLHPQQASAGISSTAIVNQYWTVTNNSAAGPTTVTPKGIYNAGDIIGGSNTTFNTQKYSGAAWLGVALATTNTSAPYTSTPTAGIAIASVAGDYIFGTPVPTISGTPTSLAYGIVATGASAVQVFSVSATTLSPTAGNLTITPTGPFLVSTSSATGPFTSSATLAYTAGTLVNAAVWVQFNPVASTGYTNTVTVSGGTASSFVVNVTGTGAAACSGTPTPGTASITPAGGNSATPFSLSLAGTTVAGGLTYQWQSASSGAGPFTNITGATTSTYGFTGVNATTYYQAVVTCPTFAAGTSNTVSATYVPPTPSCTPTGSSWAGETSYSYGANTFTLASASGPSINDPGITSTPIINTTTGYANRTGAFSPTILYLGNSYLSSITWGSTCCNQEAQIWIDFNNDGIFAPTEEVSAVTPFSTGSPAQPTNFNVTIPAGSLTGIHLMRVRALWESTGTTLGVAPAHLDPCNISYPGISLQYYSGTVCDYYVNIQTPPPLMTATPTSLTYAPTGVSAFSPARTFTLTGSYLLPAASNYTVTAPSNFQVSTDGSTWVSTYTLPYTASTISPSPTVYVRFNPTAAIAYTGTVTVTGGGATVNVPVSGNGAVVCGGAPVAGTVVASPASGGCSSFTSALSLSGSAIALNLTYQWQSSPDNSAWTDVAGATNTTYSAFVSGNIYYRCQVKCTTSTITSSTPGVLLAPGPTYATLPFFESFEAVWSSICGTNEAPNNFWRNTATSGNTSWRREDDATTGGWSGSNGLFSPSFSVGSHAARFHSYDASSGTQGSLRLYVNLPAGNNQISYDYINISGTDVIVCQVSTDGGTTYTTLDAPPSIATVWTNRTVVTTLASPTAIVRFLCTSDYGVSDIGLDNVNIVALPPCTSPTAQATALTLTPALTTIAGSFTAASPAPDRYLVVMMTSTATPTVPADGVTYTAGTSALGGTIISASSATTFTASGLTPGTPYWFWVYSYNALCLGGSTPPLYKSTTPLTNNTSTIACSLSGIKTIGATGDYISITAAMSAAANLGVSGPLAFEIQPSYSTAVETFPINIGNATCVSATNTITIRPQSTMTISGTGAPMFNFNGARYVTIDGRVGSTGTTKALTIVNTSTSGQCIQFINDASYNTVKYASVNGTNQSTTSGNIVFSTTTGTTGNDYNLIDNCDLLDATTQPWNNIYASGTTGKENDNNTISNCNIANAFSTSSAATNGISIASGNTFWNITGNRIYQTASRAYSISTTNRGISISNTSGNGFNVTGNIIGYATSTGTGTTTMTSTTTTNWQGIFLSVGNATPSSVQGNTIAGINFTTTSSTSTTGGSLCGISITSGSANIGNVTPNIIGATTGNDAIVATINTNTGGTIVGINASSANPAIINVANNKIGALTLINGSATLGGNIQGIQLSSTGTYSVTGNVIGSTSTTNSIYLSTVTTGTQLLYGINSAITTTVITAPVISGNTIANLTALSTGTGSLAAGILHTGGSTATISGNNINNIQSATANTVAASGQLAICGIAVTSAGTQAAGSLNAITLNTVNALSATNTGANAISIAGISFTSGTSGVIANQISQNRVYDLRNLSTYVGSATAPAKAVGIHLYSPSGVCNVYNNMISLGNGQATPTSFTGIMNYSSVANAINIYYNTVNIEGAAGGTSIAHTAGFLRGSYSSALTTPVNILNNIFHNSRTGGTGKNYAIANGLGATGTNSGWGVNAANNNILNSASSATVGYWGTTDQTLATWKTASAGDGNSYSNTVTSVPSTPVFVNTVTGDLHLNMASVANNFESHGITIAAVTTDYDGQTRPGTTSVNGGGFATDLGADEFDGNPNENLPPTITFTPLLGACGNGDRTFTATIVDPSGVNNTTYKPKVYFKRAIDASYYSTLGALTSGTALNGVWTFTVTAASMPAFAVGDVVSYFVIAQDAVGNVGSVPAAGLVASDVNTVTTPPTTPYTYTVLNSLSGNYNVGVAGVYTTITAAANAYTGSCLSGPVTFTLIDAAYSASETFPMVIGNNPYASATNTLTIKPAAATPVVITGLAASGSIFKLLNAQYVTLDGLNTGGASLTLNGTNTGSFTDIFLASTATTGPGNNNITLKNMNINGGTNTTASDWAILAAQDNATPSSTAGFNNDNITVTGNTFTKCGYAIYANGTVPTSAGGLDGWVISNNNMGPAVNNTTNNIGYNGMFLQNMIGPSITGNTIQNIGYPALTSQVSGITLASFVNGAFISQNTITNLSSNNSSTGVNANTGILISNQVLNTTITRNRIYTLNTIYSFGYGAKGITVNPSSNNSNTLIANNQISDIFGGGYYTSSPAGMAVGIDFYGVAGGVKMYYNAINMNSQVSGYTGVATNAVCLAYQGTGGNNELRNNILVNTFDNTAETNDKNYCIWTNAVPSSIFSSIDYNDYYVGGAATGVLAGYTSTPTDYTTIAAMAAAFGGNTHSINVNPTFVSPTTNLRLTVLGANYPFVNAGTPVSVTTDVDGLTRSSTAPVIGINEVVIPLCNNVNPGAVTQSNAICVSGTATLTPTGASAAAGILYQWKSSTDSTTWTNIGGATNVNYTIPTAITSDRFYRVVLTCAISSLTDSSSRRVTVNPNPAAITGNPIVCAGLTTTLSETAVGTWTSANTAIATVGSGSGIVTGVAQGNANVTFTTASSGCYTVTVAQVVPPAAPPTITPAATTICNNGSVNLVATPVPAINIIPTEGWETGVPNVSGAGGAVDGWTSNVAATTNFQRLSVGVSPAGITPAVGGSFLMFNSFNISSGISYAVFSPSFSMTPYAGGQVTFWVYRDVSNYNTSSFTQEGFNVMINTTPSVAGATSMGFVPRCGTCASPTGGITGTATSASGGWYQYTATIPASFTGNTNYIIINAYSQFGDNCFLDDVNIQGAVPATWSPASNLYTDAAFTVPYTTGTTTNSVYMSPATVSTQTVTNYTATITNGACPTTATAAVTVNPLPAVNTGGNVVCTGATLTMANVTAGGTWSSSSANATVVAATGVVTGVTAGTANISYILGTGCARVTTVTVNASPAAITGTLTACTGFTTTLSDATASGIWSSSAPATASVNGIGVVTGGATAGNATISYTTLNGCFATKVVTINTQPAAIAGTSAVCTGLTTVLTSATGGGAWSSLSGNVVATTGTVQGVAAGTAIVSYTLGSCSATTVVTVSQSPSAIGGTATVCEGAVTTLNNSFSGGNWTSGSANATVNALGVVAGAVAGNAPITYTLSGGCIATKVVTVNPMPGAITGTAVVCVNANTTLASSISGGAWTVNPTSVASMSGAVLTGVASGNATVTYTLPAGCSVTRVITVNPLPTAFAVTGGGGNCAGGPGVHIGLGASSSATFSYALRRGATTVATLSGANTTLDFGAFSTDGTYTVLATNTSTTCTNAMTGSAVVYTNALPFVYNVTGGGTDCAGGAGVSVGMDVTDPGINYTLKLGNAVIATQGGTGADITFAGLTTTGVYSVVATDVVTGCHSDMSGTATVTINALPLAYNVTGGGVICSDASVAVGLDNSETGINYTLYMGATAMSAAMPGTTGSPVSFGAQTVAGTYTVLATNAGTGCTKNMNGSATVTVHTTPTVQTVSGGGTYCEGDGGVHIVINNTETGISYQLFNGSTAANAPMMGTTGNPLDFVAIASGTYSVLATNATTGCHSDMTGNPVVVMNALPVAQTVSGGGVYCSGGAGLALGLDNSETGITYTLYNGGTFVSTVNGMTGSPVTFGNQTTAGVYSVLATSGAGCSRAMTGVTSIGINALPDVLYVTGGGNYCAGGNGVMVGVSGSQVGVNYQLYNGSTAVATRAGDGLVINYGPQAAAGSYSVRATNATTGCGSDMTGSVNVIVNSLPNAHVLTGGGSYCEGTPGLHLSLDVAESGVDYQLYNGTTTVGAPITGTGTGLDYGPLGVGTYTIQATDVINHCKNGMTGTSVITMNAAPVVATVTGGGAYCAGGAGVHIGIPSEANVDYTLYLGSSAISTITGTGTTPVDFGSITAAGVYTVHAANHTSACGADMAGSATVTINAQPTVYAVTGSGSYCEGGNGIEVGLTGSDYGITYQLYYNGSAIGVPVTTAGGMFSFGLQTGVGTYSVQANPTSTCTTNMAGTAVITTNPLPVVGSLTGGGSYCAGGNGVHIGLPGSVTGVNYRLYYGSTAMGIAPIAGTTGSTIDFGLMTGAGTYTVRATTATTGCVNNTSGTASVSITPTVTPGVDVVSLAGTTVCNGQMTSFHATPTNGGSTPAYQWRVNGTNVGIDSAGFTYIPANGDLVTAKLTSNATCATPDSALGYVAMTVVNNVTPTAAITNDRGAEVCINTLVTFAAATTFAGSTATYSWVKNGVPVSSALTYAYTPHDNDIVYFVLNSSLACVTSPIAYSNNILMQVDSPFVPAVTIIAYPGTTIKDGQSDTLVAYVAHGGPAPTYQWKLNSGNIAGATNASFISDALHNNDSLTCVVTGSGVCGLTSFNSVVIKVMSAVGVTEVNTGIADIRLTPNPNKGDFMIKGSLGTVTDEEVYLELTDMLGQVVYKNTVNAKNGNISEHVTLNSTLANGMYMLNLRSGSEHKVFHMVLEQ